MDRGVAALLTLSTEINKALELEVSDFAASSVVPKTTDIPEILPENGLERIDSCEIH